jgi:hypothetical protein
MIYENPLAEILSVHKFKVDRATAEMLCYVFNKDITCNRKVNKQLFNRFEKYNTLYIFSYPNYSVPDTNKSYVKLTGVEIVVQPGKEEEFMDDNSNFIFYGGTDSGLEWLDIDETNNFTGVYGSCRIKF